MLTSAEEARRLFGRYAGEQTDVSLILSRVPSVVVSLRRARITMVTDTFVEFKDDECAVLISLLSGTRFEYLDPNEIPPETFLPGGVKFDKCLHGVLPSGEDFWILELK